MHEQRPNCRHIDVHLTNGRRVGVRGWGRGRGGKEDVLLRVSKGAT